jgi:hypothetical protein
MTCDTGWAGNDFGPTRTSFHAAVRGPDPKSKRRFK